MRIVGIDPGISGGIACLNSGTGEAQVADLPVTRDKSLTWIDGLRLRDILREYGPNVVVVERVSSMRGNGVASSFKFGMAFGSILSVLEALQIRIELVTPVTWKKAFKLPGKKDKKASLNKAREWYPEVDLSLEKHHNRAEALLIAHWYITKQLPPKDWSLAFQLPSCVKIGDEPVPVDAAAVFL